MAAFPVIQRNDSVHIPKSFFEHTLGINWDMKPVDRNFDPQKVQNYVSQLPTSADRGFVLDLLSKTTYVPYHLFKDALLKSFSTFRQSIGTKPFYLARMRSKVGSEDWLTALLWPILRTMNLIDIIDEDAIISLNGKINVLILDDASYTGTNTFSKMDSIVYKSTRIEQLDNKQYRALGPNGRTQLQREASSHFTFHIVIPFITHEAHNLITQSFAQRFQSQIIFHSISVLPDLKGLVDVKQYYPEWSENDPYDTNLNNVLRQRFGVSEGWETSISKMPAVYFDHKVAANMSTFSSIYLDGRLPDGRNTGSLFKVDPSREKIIQLETLYNSQT